MNRIKEILQEKNKTRLWLSKKIQKSYTTVTNYCNNKKQPSWGDLIRIAEALDTSIDELLFPGEKHVSDAVGVPKMLIFWEDYQLN